MLILLAKEKTEQLKKISNGSTKLLLQYKVVSTDNIPLIHAKLFVIDLPIEEDAPKTKIFIYLNMTKVRFLHFHNSYMLLTHVITIK